MKEVIFKYVYSCPGQPELPTPHPPHPTPLPISSLHPRPSPNCPAACLPILSFCISSINQHVTAVTTAYCFARHKLFKMNFNWPGLGIHFILCMSDMYNRPFGAPLPSPPNKKMVCGSGMMPKKSQAIKSWLSRHPKQKRYALDMHAFSFPG